MAGRPGGPTPPRLAGTPSATAPAHVADSVLRTTSTGLVGDARTGTPNRLLCKGPTIKPANVCTDWRFSGTCAFVTQDDSDLWDDAIGDNAISSLTVPAGQWVVLYRDVGYGGICRAFNADSTFLQGTRVGNDTVSSYRVASNSLGCPTS